MAVLLIDDRKEVDRIQKEIADLLIQITGKEAKEVEKENEKIQELIELRNNAKFEYHLSDKINFNILSKAYDKGLTGDGFRNAEAGKIVFDALYLQNRETLEELQEDKNSKLYFALCCESFKLIDLDIAELKKNS